MLSGKSIKELEKIATQSRLEIIKMITEAGSGHPGGSLSIIDLLVVLYSNHLKHNPKNPGWEERDRVVLSKGHVCPALYTVLAFCG
ncbi:MAG: transketolase, partial [Elusimicrobiota bacterium]